MKKIIALCVILILFFFTDALYNIAYSRKNGSPSGNTGSPGDAQTCARVGCHTGTATTIDSIISTNIPPSGYLADSTYQITVSIFYPGRNTFGFQASPQDFSGNQLGNIIVTDMLQTKLTGLGKYITHTGSGIEGTDGKTWTFNWIPLSSTGNVTFYVAVNAANGDGLASGDIIYNSSITVNEDSANIPLSINEYTDAPQAIVNNPVQNILQIKVPGSFIPGEINIFDMQGKLKRKINNSANTLSIPVNELLSGMYILQLKQYKNIRTEKFIKL